MEKSDFLTVRQVIELYPFLSRAKLSKDRMLKRGFPYYQLNPHKPLYRRSEIEASLAAHPVEVEREI